MYTISIGSSNLFETLISLLSDNESLLIPWTIFVLLIGFSGCFGEDKKVKAPKKDHIFVKNDGVENFKVDVQNRVKEKILVPFRETIKIEFLATKTKTVLVKTKSQDPNWNNCSIAMQVGQTLVVHRKYENIECKAE